MTRVVMCYYSLIIKVMIQCLRQGGKVLEFPYEEQGKPPTSRLSCDFSCLTLLTQGSKYWISRSYREFSYPNNRISYNVSGILANTGTSYCSNSPFKTAYQLIYCFLVVDI